MKHLRLASVLIAIGFWSGATPGAVAGPPGELHGVAAGSGAFVAVGKDGAILSSTDMLHWTNRNSGVTEILLDTGFGPDQFLVVGEAGTILTSPDGGEWTKRESGTSQTLRATAYGGGQFLAVGDVGTVVRSLDGATWTVVAAGMTHRLNDVIYAGGMFVAVGGASTNANMTGYIHTSADGETWNQRAEVPNSELLGTEFGNGRFVALGMNGTVMISTDGITWSRTFTGAYGETARVAHGNGRFGAVMGSSTFFTSSNGLDWSGSYVSGASTLRGVTYSNGRFVAVGLDLYQQGIIVLSSDGANWGNVLLPLSSPVITYQPQSAEVLAGNSWSFHVSVAANPAPNLQWRFNNTVIPGATESQLNFNNVTASQAGDYSVVASNELGSVTSLVARLLVKMTAPEFVAQPQDSEAYVGGSISLYAYASGSPAPTYRWLLNGASIAGQTNESLYFASAVAARAGNYSVVASNLIGIATSRVARLTVSPAVFWSQPQSQFVTSGSELHLDAGVGSTAGNNFRWYFNGTVIPGANTPSLTRSPVNTNHAGSYFVVVSNTYGSVTSAVVGVGVDRMAPIVTRQPEHQTVPSGEWASFQVNAVGSPSLLMQWRRNAAPIPGATGFYYQLTATSANAGDYDVVIRNTYGSVTSAVAVLTATAVPLHFTREPNDLTVRIGDSAYLDAAVTGSPAPTFRWYRNGVAIPGATGSPYYLNSVTFSKAGEYIVVASNSQGSITSRVARVSVYLVPPYFTSHPFDQAVLAGQSFSLSASADGAPAPVYQWFSDGLPLPGETSSSLYFPNPAPAQSGSYSVTASNVAGVAFSRTAMVTISNLAPIFVQEPDKQTVSWGGWVNFHSFAVGGPPPRYQWFFNGTALRGATGQDLYLNQVTPDQAGRYVAVANNIFGVTTSAVAVLTVLSESPVLTTQPTGRNALWGESVYLYGSASGAPPPLFQWLFNGVPIPGEVYSGLSLNSVTPAQAGNYQLVASNAVGVVTSTVAVVTVHAQAPVFTQQPSSQTVLWGGSAGFYASASGGPYPTYQWLFNGVPIQGSVSPSIFLSDITPARAGNYRLVASNAVGVVTSAVAVLTVTTEAPVFYYQPQDQIVLWGVDLSLYAAASGGPTPTYQWWYNGAPIPKETNNWFQIRNALPSQSGNYHLVASNLAGVATSAVAVVTVEAQAPFFVNEPADVTRLWGESVSLSVYALGGPPPTLQWMYNGAPVAGATNSQLAFPYAIPAQSGNYFVVASNVVGVTTSAVAVVTVEAQAPIFLAEPEDATVRWGDSFNSYVAAYGGPPPTLQWRFNGTTIPRETNNYLSFQFTTPARAGAYSVVASNAVGVATSAVAVLTVYSQTPVFSERPTSQSVLWGDSIQLYASAWGGPPPTLQWLFNDTPIAGARDNQFIIPYALPSHSGNYTVVASNVVGVITSAVAVVTVEAQAPIFQDEPFDATVLWGDSFYFYARAYGGPPPTLQWLFNGTAIPGKTDNTLNFPFATPSQSGDYRVVASNVVGVTTSRVAVLTVHSQAPFFTQEPSAQSLLWGESLFLYASAWGGPPPTLQWLFHGVPVANETNNSFHIGYALPTHSGDYTVVASNIVGVTTSAVAVVTVETQAPVFQQEPQDATVLWGTGLGLYASAYGGPPPTLQWLFNGAPIPHETNNYLNFPFAVPTQAGAYAVTASNAVGVTTSRIAILTVQSQAPIFTQQPESRSVLWGDYVFVYGLAVGGPPPTFQWLFNDAPKTGATNTYLELGAVGPTQSGNYTLVASNVVGVATSLVATVTVNSQAPVFTQQPESRSVLWGDYVSVYGLAVGGPPPTFQWLFNGAPILTATNTYLSLGNVVPSQSGDYALVASNLFGVATSVVAVVMVNSQPPYFTAEPDDRVVLWGDYAQFHADAVAGPPATYQWFFNEALLPNETNSYLFIPDTGTNFAGPYYVVAMNPFGAATSRVATLSVESARPYFHDQPSDTTALWGSTVYFNSWAIGGPPADYQWRFKGVPIPGATNSSLPLFNVSTNDNGFYDVIASNFLGAITSRTASLVVDVREPVFVYHWSGTEVTEGDDVNLFAVAYGGPVPALHLLLNGSPLALPYSEYSGFLLTEVTTNDAGNYSFIASNRIGSVTSSGAALNVLPGGPLDRWKRRNPRPQAENLLAVTHGNGRIVATGERGSIVVSSNGSNWVAQRLRTDAALPGVTFGNGRYVVVTRAGNILSSSNAMQWLPCVLDSTLVMEGVTFGNGRFVAVGGPHENVSLVSTNGIDWTGGSGPVSAPFKGVTWGNGLFVGVIQSQGTWPAILVSSNGIDWLVADAGLVDNLENVAFGDGQFVAVGSDGAVLTSADGWAWTRRSSGTAQRLIETARGNGRWVAVGEQGVILSSSSGAAWRSENSGTAHRLDGVTFAGGLFVAVGESGITLTSPDGTLWTKRNLGTTRDLEGITIGRNGQVVAVGKFGTILTTPDGAHITERTSGTTNDLHGATYANDLYVTVGDGGAILTSRDGTAWHAGTFMPENDYNGVGYGDGLWVAVGARGVIVTSPDGVNWTARASGAANDLNSVAYGNGIFMVVGDNFPSPEDGVLVSSDGVSWVGRSVFGGTFSTGTNLRALTFAEGMFVVFGDEGAIYVTADGNNWEQRDPGDGYGRTLRNATYAAGHWVVVGDNGLILTSTNTINWQRRSSRAASNLFGVGYVNGTFVTVGNRGTLLFSGRVLGTELKVRQFLPGLGFVFAIEAEMDRDYRLQGSDDLQTWSDLLDFNNTQTTTLFLDEEAGFFPSRFYRVVSP